MGTGQQLERLAGRRYPLFCRSRIQGTTAGNLDMAFWILLVYLVDANFLCLLDWYHLIKELFNDRCHATDES